MFLIIFRIWNNTEQFTDGDKECSYAITTTHLGQKQQHLNSNKLVLEVRLDKMCRLISTTLRICSFLYHRGFKNFFLCNLDLYHQLCCSTIILIVVLYCNYLEDKHLQLAFPGECHWPVFRSAWLPSTSSNHSPTGWTAFPH